MDKNNWLRHRTEFKAIYGTRYRIRVGRLLLLAKPNSLAGPRLGLTIAKKQIKLAVQRNRIKRLVRESFRQHGNGLPCVDMVLLVYKGIEGIDNKQLYQCLETLWQQLITRSGKFLSS